MSASRGKSIVVRTKPLSSAAAPAPASGVYLDQSRKLLQQWIRHNGAFLCQVPMAAMVLNDKGAVMLWNPQAEVLFGYGRGEITGCELPMAGEEDRDTWRRLLSKAFGGNELEKTLAGMLRQDGSAFLAKVRMQPLEESERQVFGALVYVEDLSELETLREQVQKNRSLRRVAGKMAKLGAWSIEIPKESQMVFPGMPRNFKAVLERYPFLEEMIHNYIPEDHERLAAAFAGCIEDGKPFDLKARIRDAEGKMLWVRSTGEPVADAFGNVYEILGGVQDVTEFAAAQEQAILQSAALSALDNMLVITDVHGRIEWANPSYFRVTGYTKEEVKGRMLPELRRKEAHIGEEFDKMWKTILAGKVWQGEVTSETKSGAGLVERITVTPFCLEGDQITHFVAVKEDCTEQKKIEKQVLRAQRTDSLGSLAGGIAHDLNNVLYPMIMGLELLEQDEPDTGRRQMISNLLSSARQGSDLVKQILAFARGNESRRMPLDLRMPMRELQRMVERTFPKAIESHFGAAEDLWQILADPTQIHQVMLNLCMNARDAMPEGGRMHVSLQNCVLDPRYASADVGLKSGPHVLLEVRDSGCGIPKENWDKLFDPFFTTKSPGSGTGLGLATLQQIINKHGGRVHFESVMNRGTVFRVYFPVEDQEMNRQFLEPNRNIPRGRGQRVLLVDDVDPVRLMTQETLRRYGYRVFSTANGEVALHELKQNPREIQLLLVDMDMPVMDGPHLIREVRLVRPDMPILGYSGHAKADVVEAANRAGMHEFLHKPCSTAELLTRIQQMLNPE